MIKVELPVSIICFLRHAFIGVDSGGQPGHAPPIIKMGGKPLFVPQ